MIYPNEDGIKNLCTRYDHSQWDCSTELHSWMYSSLYFNVSVLFPSLHCNFSLPHCHLFKSNWWRVDEWVRDCCLTPRQHFFQLHVSYGENKLSFYLIILFVISLSVLFRTTVSGNPFVIFKRFWLLMRWWWYLFHQLA